MKKNVNSKAASKSKSPNRKSGKRVFPKASLEEALVVPLKIKELNGGNPWSPADIAKACDLSATTTSFYYLTAAARDYGLTLGTRETEKIELTELGREIVYAPNATVELKSKLKAFLNVEVFKNVLEYYKGGVLPEMKYLGNTLEKEFSLAAESHEEFSKIFKENCKYLDIRSGKGTGTFSTDGAAIPSTVVIGEPAGEKAPKLFVIMPFTEKQPHHALGFFNEALQNLITPAAVQAGFQVETANRQGSDVIQSTIINDLIEADLVLADLTEHNPNVLFELGVRMALNKPVVLIKAKGTGRIFDIDNMLRVYEYEPNLWQSSIETDLPKVKEHIESAWKNRTNEHTYMTMLLKGTNASVIESFAKINLGGLQKNIATELSGTA